METIKIDWHGPYKFDGDDRLHKKQHDTLDKDKNLFSKIGLYQVYGHHPVYGPNVLLYIGITTEQFFERRLKNRNWKYDNYDTENIEVYLGKLINGKSKIDEIAEKKLIKKAEALLIYIHSPAKNSSYIKSVNYDELKNVQVWNLGNCRDLITEVSSTYWLDELENYQIINNLVNNPKNKLLIQKDNQGTYGFFMDTTYTWIGVDSDIWDNQGIPLVIAFSKEKWNTKKTKNIISQDDKWLNYELNFDDDVDVDEITVETIKEKIQTTIQKNSLIEQ